MWRWRKENIRLNRHQPCFYASECAWRWVVCAHTDSMVLNSPYAGGEVWCHRLPRLQGPFHTLTLTLLASRMLLIIQVTTNTEHQGLTRPNTASHRKTDVLAPLFEKTNSLQLHVIILSRAHQRLRHNTRSKCQWKKNNLQSLWIFSLLSLFLFFGHMDTGNCLLTHSP